MTRKIVAGFALTAALFAMGGCVTTSAGCPTLKGYTRAQMQAVAAELAKDPNSNVAAFVADYGQLRAACRALAGS